MPSPTSTLLASSRVVINARNAVMIVFAANGFAFASWMGRLPQVRDALGLTPGELGRLLLALAAGAVVALPTAGFVVNRLGAARTVALGSILAGGGLVVASVGVGTLTSVPVVAVGLAAFGYGSGSWDVAMNVEGAAVERLRERAIMPRFHAAFSLGAVLGAGSAAGLTWLGVSVVRHVTVVGIAVIVLVLLTTRHFLPRGVEGDDDAHPKHSVLEAWREPRTLLVGVMVLCFALIEGIANDWLAVGLVDGYGVESAVGSAGFAVFVLAMTTGRLAGPWFLGLYGRQRVISVSGALVAAGALATVVGGTLQFAAIGIVLWGFGAALGFPVGMSTAADDPPRAAARVSVVASIGYTAFLAGPPLLGWIGDHQGVLRALLVAVAAGLLGGALSRVARRNDERTSTGD